MPGAGAQRVPVAAAGIPAFGAHATPVGPQRLGLFPRPKTCKQNFLAASTTNYPHTTLCSVGQYRYENAGHTDSESCGKGRPLREIAPFLPNVDLNLVVSG